MAEGPRIWRVWIGILTVVLIPPRFYRKGDCRPGKEFERKRGASMMESVVEREAPENSTGLGAIVMLETRPLCPNQYWTQSIISNWEYSQRHKYAFSLHNLTHFQALASTLIQSYGYRIPSEYPVAWYRIAALRHSLAANPNAKWVFYLDSDTYIRLRNKPLVEYIESLSLVYNTPQGSHLILAREEAYPPGEFHSPQRLNAGVLAVRNTPLAYQFLRYWSTAIEDGVCDRKYQFDWPLEQRCLESIFYADRGPSPSHTLARSIVGLARMRDLNSPWGLNIVHIWGSPQWAPRRSTIFKNHLDPILSQRGYVETKGIVEKILGEYKLDGNPDVLRVHDRYKAPSNDLIERYMMGMVRLLEYECVQCEPFGLSEGRGEKASPDIQRFLLDEVPKAFVILDTISRLSQLTPTSIEVYQAFYLRLSYFLHIARSFKNVKNNSKNLRPHPRHPRLEGSVRRAWLEDLLDTELVEGLEGVELAD
ncbi:hypothetical protein AAMO2058_000862900 [Amorphochlora amoebiformis]